MLSRVQQAAAGVQLDPAGRPAAKEYTQQTYDGGWPHSCGAEELYRLARFIKLPARGSIGCLPNLQCTLTRTLSALYLGGAWPHAAGRAALRVRRRLGRGPPQFTRPPAAAAAARPSSLSPAAAAF